MHTWNIAIIGPGAMGLMFAGLLHKKAAVTIIDYRPERADAIQKGGICMEGIDETLEFRLPVACGLEGAGKPDLVMLCVKAYHTESAARDIERAGYRGPLLTLQNGLGNVDILRQHLPDAEILFGVTSEGATLLDVGHVRHAGRGKTAIGQLDPGRPHRSFMEKLIALFRDAGLEMESVSDVEPLIWGKLIINAGINALTALLGVRNGKLLEIPSARELMSKLVVEAFEVSRKKGLVLPYEDPVVRVEEVCRMTASNFSSMNQDVNNRRKTEIDFINDAVVREGAKLGLACPFNEAITYLIHALEEQQ